MNQITTTSTITNEMKTIIKEMYFPKSTDTEFCAFLFDAQAKGLNPLQKEIIPIQFKGRTTTIVSRDGYVKKAKENPNFLGYRSQAIYENDEFNYTYQRKSLECQLVTFFNGILIEHKDSMDFMASLKDSRIQNQRLKMINVAKKKGWHPYVVLQGTYNNLYSQLKKRKISKIQMFTKKQWIGAITSLEEMGIGVINIEPRTNFQDLAYVIESLAEHKQDNKTRKYHQIFIEPQGPTWDAKAYQCFDGIGYTKAKVLSEMIPIRDLLRRPRPNAVEALTSVKGVGEKLANKILDELEREPIKPLRDIL